MTTNGETAKDAGPRPKASAYANLVARSKASADCDENWLITLSDLMTLLLVFFVMFFAVANNAGKNKTQAEPPVKAQQPVAAVRPQVQDTAEKIKEEMVSTINSLGMKEDVSVQTGNSEIVITMKERLTFKPAEADMLGSSDPVMEKIARLIKDNPSFLVEIDGHTDNVPIKTAAYPSNWELSVARATSVLKYFINRHNIEPSRFYIKGNADQRPVVPNTSPELRAQNRRVEIRLKEINPSL